MDDQLTALRAGILDERVPRGDFRTFHITDPKPRIIHAACFADRVLHHAVMRHAGPVLERALIDRTYACLSGRGVHAGIRRVQHDLRRAPWVVQIDIDGYFAAIEHERLMRILMRKFKGAAFGRLLQRLVAANGGLPNRGLPIGSLTSQHFANYFLDGVDRYVTQTLGHGAYVRYMDDILWCCDTRDQARDSLLKVSN